MPTDFAQDWGKTGKKGPLKFEHNKGKMTKTHIMRKIVGDGNCLF